MARLPSVRYSRSSVKVGETAITMVHGTVGVHCAIGVHATEGEGHRDAGQALEGGSEMQMPFVHTSAIPTADKPATD